MTSRKTLIVPGAALCIAVALLSMRYLIGFGPVPPNVAANLFAKPWLLIHIAGASIALLVGPFQFSKSLRQTRPLVHRYLGRLYAAGCITGGLSGIVLAFGASTGPIATAGFGLLAVAWIVTTGLAWARAVQRRFPSHRAWIIRSFALTMAAVTLRLYLPILLATPFSFEAGYQAISFLCWVPNLILAEVYLHRPVVMDSSFNRRNIATSLR